MTNIWFTKLTSDIKLSVRILIALNSNIKIKVEILGTERFVLLSVEECYERQKSLGDYFLLCSNCIRVSVQADIV